MLKNIFCFFVFSIFLISTNFAQEQEISAEQKAYMEYMTPSWGHEFLAKSVGDWTTSTKIWMAPGMDPEVSKGESKFEMILGGRYLKGTHTGTAIGMPMEGLMIQAYDNKMEKFVTTWIDNMGTGITMSSGKYDKKSNSIVSHGSSVDPVSGGDMNYKSVTKIVNDKTTIFTMYLLKDKNEFKMMEMTYTKK